LIPLDDPEPRIWGDVISGIALGSLVGLLVGLSTSPVVGAVISGLVALLATYLGLNGSALPKKPGERAKSLSEVSRSHVRIACFSAGAIIGVLLGVVLRTHDALGISKADRLKEWRNLGLSDHEARHLVVLGELGLVPKTWPPSSDSTPIDVSPDGKENRRTRVTELYGATADECRQLRPDQFSSPAETVNAWKLQGGKWAEAGNVVASTSPETQASAAQAIWDLACKL
jgi:hypothetical protein